jgi:hypothetical protein
VEDHETLIHLICSYSVGGARRANSLGETEGQVADECADEDYNADKSHLLPPGSLLRFLRLAKTAQNSIGTPESDNAAVDIPKAGWLHGRAVSLNQLTLFPALQLALCMISPQLSITLPRPAQWYIVVLFLDWGTLRCGGALQTLSPACSSLIHAFRM